MTTSSHESDKQRVLVLSGWYPSSREPTNGDFVQEQIRLLRREGFSIDLMYADLNVGYLLDGNSKQRTHTSIDEDGNRDVILSGPFWPKNQAWGLKKWVGRYAQLIEEQLKKRSPAGQPHLIHAHTYLGGAVALSLHKKLRIPYLITEHYTGWLDGSIKGFHKNVGTQAFDHAASILAVSPSLNDGLQKVTSSQVHTFPNFIDTSFFRPSSSSKSKEFHYVGVGDLISRKNWKELILAFSQVAKSHPSSKLTIAGDGDLKNSLTQLIESLQLASKISLVGHLGKKELLQLYQSAHVLVHTSKTETFGLSMIEAMSCGIPVISYPHQTSSFIINQKYLGIVTSEYNTSALSDTMRVAQDNYSNYNFNVIRNSIEKRFGPKKAAKGLRAIYSRVALE